MFFFVYIKKENIYIIDGFSYRRKSKCQLKANLTYTPSKPLSDGTEELIQPVRKYVRDILYDEDVELTQIITMVSVNILFLVEKSSAEINCLGVCMSV